jgi:hypothetical protein
LQRVVDGKFERGATDVVSIACADLGTVQKIRIGSFVRSLVCVDALTTISLLFI